MSLLRDDWYIKLTQHCVEFYAPRNYYKNGKCVLLWFRDYTPENLQELLEILQRETKERKK